MATALLVDDDQSFTPALAELVEQEGFSVSVAHSLQEAEEHLDKEIPDVAFIDLVLPDGNGIELIRRLENFSGTAVVVITGHASLDSALEALRSQVWDYLTKPLDMQLLKSCLRRLDFMVTHGYSPPEPTDADESAAHFGLLFGASMSMRHVYDLIRRVAPTDATVFVLGESGTGKELVARAVYENSERSEGPFLALNCGAISPSLIASELFGHEAGAFTGAARRHKGFFERADGGTLFLDEISEMPLELQVNLLRVLETGKVTRVGGDRDIPVDVRVIVASNRDPDEAVAEGALRKDLLFRLMVFPLQLPPLRERHGDIALLAKGFLDQLNEDHGTEKTFSSRAMEVLEAHSWPGNVRELRNAVQRAFILADRVIDIAQVAQWTGLSRDGEGRFLSVPLGTSIDEAQKKMILATLDHFDGDKQAAAQTLGVSLKTLYNRLNRYRETAE